MAELAFLAAVRDYLATRPLVPPVASQRLGVTEPVAGADLPCVVLSLDRTERRRVGLGDKSEQMHGALPVRATIDLANPVLPDDPAFRLVDVTGRILTLPHGGLVTRDGEEPLGPLGANDIAVTLDGAAVGVTGAAPGAGAVRADGVTGQLTFGSALPAAGVVVADYFLGEWTRRVEHVAGVLRVDACAASAADAGRLADAVVARLLAPEAAVAIVHLLALDLAALGPAVPVPPPAAPAPGVAHSRRSARFTFDYQRLVDAPEAAGGIIHRIQVVTRLESAQVDRRTQAVSTQLFVEVS